MQIDVSRETADRLTASASARGVSVAAYIEEMFREREEIEEIVQRSGSRSAVFHDDAVTRIEVAFLESEHGEVVDGETFARELLAELDAKERAHQGE